MPEELKAREVITLAEAFSSRRNSIAFLRWLFAIAVVVDHSWAIGQFNHGNGPFSYWMRLQTSLGDLAVVGFFVLSGFLVTRSRDRMSSGARYLWNRFLRIFPGFWVCLALTAFALAPIEWHDESNKSFSVLFGLRNGPFQYVRNDFFLTMHQWEIGPLLSHTPRALSGAHDGAAWDGSLWTLIFEFKCYLVVAVVCVAATQLVRRRTFVVLTLLTATVVTIFEVNPKSTILHAVPFVSPAPFARFTLCFMFGALAYLYADRIPIRKDALFIAAAVFLYTLHEGGVYLIGFAAFAYCVLATAVLLPIYHWDRIGDLSYGIYIYAFPAQMLMAAHGFQRFGVTAFVTASILFSSLAAFASWHVIEKRALRLKNVSWSRKRIVLRSSRSRVRTAAERSRTRVRLRGREGHAGRRGAAVTARQRRAGGSPGLGVAD